METLVTWTTSRMVSVGMLVRSQAAAGRLSVRKTGSDLRMRCAWQAIPVPLLLVTWRQVFVWLRRRLFHAVPETVIVTMV